MVRVFLDVEALFEMHHNILKIKGICAYQQVA